MTEVLNPENSVVTLEPEGTAPAATENKKDRFVYSDAQATAERTKKAEAGENVSLNSSINPLLLEAVIQTASKVEAYRDTNNDRPGLKDGTISDLVREWARAYSGFDGPVVLTKQRETNAAVTQANNFKAATLMVFKSARDMVAAFGVPEEQVMAMQFAKVRETGAEMAPNVVITDEMLTELWQQSAA